GWLGDPVRACRCTQSVVDGYQRRLSGPLVDRIDLQVCVRGVPLAERGAEPHAEPTRAVRERVLAARARQHARQGCLNAQLKPSRLRQFAAMEPGSKRT